MIKMIALDLDGTLAIANHAVSPATREALKALHEDGVEVVIATGRRYRTTRFVIDNLGFEVYAVCNGGALVKDADQATLHTERFCAADLAAAARDAGLTLFAQRDAHDLGGADFIIDNRSPWNEMTRQHQARNAEWCEAADLSLCEPEFMVAGSFGTLAECRQLAGAIEDALPGQYNSIIVPYQDSDGYYCEIAQRHVDKWHGLSKLMQHFAIDADQVCAVGDELNDVPMIQSAGHGVAMGNGNAELKALARFVCGNNDADGIVDVVRYIRDFNDNL